MKRMIDDYIDRFYNKEGKRTAELKASDYAKAREIVAWKERVAAAWDGIKVLNVEGSNLANSMTGQEYQVQVEGDAFTGNGKVKFVFNIEKGENLKFKFRIPSWSTKTALMFNGVEYSNVEAGTYYEVEEFVENRDVFEIDLDNRIKVDTQDGKVMLKKGAYVLARDERYLEDIDAKVQIKIEPNNTVKGKLIKTGKFNAIGEYQIPLKKGGYITMCDYASAGKKWDDKKLDRITVWMD
jgi:hypothetical protein